MRADVTETLCVQGAPGTGKTAVGLHRAAYLLYTHRDRLRRGGVLVVGPNSAFLSYISAVLPALGEVDVRQVTLEELVGHRVEVRAVDPAPLAVLKGDPRMATVLSRAVHAGLVPPTEPLVLPRGSHRWRVPTHELRDMVAELTRRRRPLRRGPGDARAAAGARAAHQDGGGRRVPGRPDPGRGGPQRARCARRSTALWPAVDPVRVVMALLSDPAVLARAADGVLDPDEQALLLWPKPAARPEVRALVAGRRGARRRGRRPGRPRAEPRPRRARRGAGPVADAAARGRPPVLHRLGHGARRHRAGHHAVGHRRLGRVAARTSASRPRTSRCCAAATGCPRRSSSSPRGCCRTSRPGSSAPESVRENHGRLDLLPTGDVVTAVAAEVRRVLAEPGSVGVVVADADVDGRQPARSASGTSCSAATTTRPSSPTSG